MSVQIASHYTNFAVSLAELRMGELWASTMANTILETNYDYVGESDIMQFDDMVTHTRNIQRICQQFIIKSLNQSDKKKFA